MSLRNIINRHQISLTKCMFRQQPRCFNSIKILNTYYSPCSIYCRYSCVSNSIFLYKVKNFTVSVRDKHGKQDGKRKIVNTDSDDEEHVNWNDDDTLNKDSKVVTLNLTSMRTDLILKSALKIARNKIENLFYQSKIRINGTKLMKKSAQIYIGDEVDIVRTFSSRNPSHLVISRIEILDVSVASEESIRITVRVFKSLLIENYDDPYKASSE